LKEREAPDLIIFFVVLILITFGLVMILSASSIRSQTLYQDSFYLFKRQLLWAIIGIGALILFMNIDYHFYQKHARTILFITISGLILVLLPGVGHIAGGSRRWIGFGFFQLQPSELAKLGLVIYLSYCFTRKSDRTESFLQGILPPLFIIGAISGLILLEPDLGTAVTIAGTSFIMLFVAGARLSHLFLLFLSGIPLVFYFILNEDYRRERLFSFLDPWADPLDTGYHIIQSLLALEIFVSARTGYGLYLCRVG